MKDGSERERLELALACSFAVLVAVPFWGKPAHVDEPFFLAIARQILRDPLHPLDFSLHVYGRLRPMWEVNNTPPLFPYLLAGAAKLLGTAPALLRLALLPLDLLSAASLYLIAARVLRRPLLPTLIVLAAPALTINLNHLMPEKALAAFGFAGLYALLRGVEDGRRVWYWASAGLIAAALLCKYNAVFLLLPAAGFQLERRVPVRRALAHLTLCAAPLALYLAVEHAARGAAPEAAWRVLSEVSSLPTSSWSHRLRAALAFVGGGAAVTALWPWAAFPARGAGAAVAAAAALLFVPWMDLGPVRGLDRWTGAVLAAGAARGLWGALVESRAERGWALLAPWLLGALMLQTLFYWSIMARFVLFCLPPLVFLLAAALERRLGDGALSRVHAASLAGTLALSGALSYVDHRYASVQRTFAGQVVSGYAGGGKRLLCAAQGGLQRHLEDLGVPPLDGGPAGWSGVRAGDVVVLSRVGTPPGGPGRPLRADVSRLSVEEPIPLRLMSGWTGEGGFYSSFAGFLPFSLSREPLEEFTVVEVR